MNCVILLYVYCFIHNSPILRYYGKNKIRNKIYRNQHYNATVTNEQCPFGGRLYGYKFERNFNFCFTLSKVQANFYYRYFMIIC